MKGTAARTSGKANHLIELIASVIGAPGRAGGEASIADAPPGVTTSKRQTDAPAEAPLAIEPPASEVSAHTVIEGSAAVRRRPERPLTEFQRRAAEYKAKIALEEEERRRVERERIAREHEVNFEKFVLHRKSYETEEGATNILLYETEVTAPEHIDFLLRKEAFKKMTFAELRGYEYAKHNGDTGLVNGAMRQYRKLASTIYSVPQKNVTGEMIGTVGAYIHARRAAEDAILQEKYNDAYSLKEWPGIGFGGFTRRKLEELWSLYNTDGRVIHHKLPGDCGVVHFAGVGEVIVHKSAIPLAKQLKDAWATERWKYLPPLDARQAVADIRRTQGLGAINQILSLAEKIANMKVEATSNSDQDHDYAFKLPYVEPHSEGVLWDVDLTEIREKLNHRHVLSHQSACNHNNIYPPYRLRYNLTKSSFLEQFLLEFSMNNRISYKSIRDLDDK